MWIRSSALATACAVVIFIIIQHRFVAGSTKLQLVDGRYNNLLLFLEEDWAKSLPVEHYVALLRNFRAGVEQASSVLASLTEAATGRRLTIGSVSVLVSARLGRQLARLFPKSSSPWHPRQAEWQRRDRADFIASPDLSPAVEGPESMVAACAIPAPRVLLAAESLEARHRDTLGRRLALYFSQYRWGLLSEAPLGSLLQTVATSAGKRQYRAASCSSTLQTELRIVGDGGGQDNRVCTFNLDTKQLSENCSIVVTEQPNADAASFLFAPYSPGVTRFCDSLDRATSHKLVHNKGADNLLNKHCGGLSAAEILRMHEDFQGAEASSAGTAGRSSGIDFQLVAEADRRRVVVVMDTSGSMLGNRINNMIGAVNQFLTEVLENGVECALISFNTSPTVVQNFLTINSQAVRQQLAKSVSGLSATGGTCIGGAVQRAMQLLGVDPNSPNRRSTGQIILLTDGHEGCSDTLDSVIGALAATSLEVVSIRYGDQADPRISRLAEVTGGRQFFGEAAGAGGLAAAGLRLSLVETTAGVAAADRVITLVTQEIQPNFQQLLEFNIDASVRRDLVFELSFPTEPTQAANLRIMIRSPSGKTFNCTGGSDSACTVNTVSGTVSARIPDADIEVGRWTLENLAARSRVVRQIPKRWKRQLAGGMGNGLATISGRPGSASTEFSAALSGNVFPTRIQQVTEETRIGVYARLLRGSAPVKNARLFAVVRTNEGPVARFNLSDNGAGADLKADDGTYSGYIPAASVRRPRDYSISLISTAPVNRTASAGKLTVVAENPSFDRRKTPPIRITDLRLSLSIAKRSAVLSWTAVEDPSGQSVDGTVPAYTIRFAASPEELLNNFITAQELVATSKTSVNVFDKVASRGLSETFLAVAAISAANVTAAVSNIVAIDDPTATPPPAELVNLGINIATVSIDKPTVTPSPTELKTVGINVDTVSIDHPTVTPSPAELKTVGINVATVSIDHPTVNPSPAELKKLGINLDTDIEKRSNRLDCQGKTAVLAMLLFLLKFL